MGIETDLDSYQTNADSLINGVELTERTEVADSKPEKSTEAEPEEEVVNSITDGVSIVVSTDTTDQKDSIETIEDGKKVTEVDTTEVIEDKLSADAHGEPSKTADQDLTTKHSSISANLEIASSDKVPESTSIEEAPIYKDNVAKENKKQSEESSQEKNDFEESLKKTEQVISTEIKQDMKTNVDSTETKSPEKSSLNSEDYKESSETLEKEFKGENLMVSTSTDAVSAKKGMENDVISTEKESQKTTQEEEHLEESLKPENFCETSEEGKVSEKATHEERKKESEEITSELAHKATEETSKSELLETKVCQVTDLEESKVENTDVTQEEHVASSKAEDDQKQMGEDNTKKKVDAPEISEKGKKDKIVGATESKPEVVETQVREDKIDVISSEKEENVKGDQEEHHEGVLNEAKEVKEEITFNSDQQSVPVKITTTEVGKDECKDSSPKDVLQMINMDESSIKLEDE